MTEAIGALAIIVLVGLLFFFTNAAPEQIPPNDDPNRPEGDP